MPTKPPRPCRRCGQVSCTCTATVDNQHRADPYRGSRHARGYGHHWTAKYRPWYLTRNPLCGNREADAPKTDDSVCMAEGRITPATVVDHIVPVSGPYDPNFFRPEAHQALCASCHNKKRARESRDT